MCAERVGRRNPYEELGGLGDPTPTKNWVSVMCAERVGRPNRYEELGVCEGWETQPLRGIGCLWVFLIV